MRLPFAASPEGVRLQVRLSPKASADRIQGVVEEADGRCALKVAVTAPPEAGKANEALLALLARVLRVKRRDLSLALGAADRRKLVLIEGDPGTLAAAMEEALAPWLKPE